MEASPISWALCVLQLILQLILLYVKHSVNVTEMHMAQVMGFGSMILHVPNPTATHICT